jgi:hypothetical protein
MCYPTNALHEKIYLTYIYSYMFRHPGAILRDSLQQVCTRKPVNMNFVHFITSLKSWCVKIHIIVKTHKIDINADLQYSGVL